MQFLQQFIHTLQHSDEPWGIKNTRSEYVFANHAFYQLCDFPAGYDIQGRTEHELPLDTAEYADLFIKNDRYVEQHQVTLDSLNTFAYGDKQGVLHTYFGNHMPLLDEQGNCIGTLYQLRKVNLFSPHAFFSHNFKGHALFRPPSRRFTDKEWQMIYLLFCGLSNKQMAKLLSLSLRAVEARLRSCMTKIGTPNRNALLEYCRYRHWQHYIPPFFLQKGHIVLTEIRK